MLSVSLKDPKDKSEAAGLKSSIQSKEFVINLIIFESILKSISICSHYLQEESLHLVKAVKVITSMKTSITNKLSEKSFKLCREEIIVLLKIEKNELNSNECHGANKRKAENNIASQTNRPKRKTHLSKI